MEKDDDNEEERRELERRFSDEHSGYDRRQTKIKVPTPWGTMEIRGLGTILALSLIAQAVTAYAVYKHDTSTTSVAAAIENLAIAQRENSCILSKEQGPDRQRAYETGACRRMALIGSRVGGVE